MRRLLIIGVLVCLAVPSAAWALRRAPGDGTLAVRNGSGNLNLNLRAGAVIGKLDAGTLIVTVQALLELTAEETCSGLNVWGADGQPDPVEQERGEQLVVVCRFTEFATRGSPEPMRFRLEDRFVLAIRKGRGFSLSAVGRGFGSIEGAGGADGLWSANARPFESLPDEREQFVLRAATLP